MIGLKWDSLGARSEGNGFGLGVWVGVGLELIELACIGALAINSCPVECDCRFVNIKLCLMLFNIREAISLKCRQFNNILDAEEVLQSYAYSISTQACWVHTTEV